MLLWPLAVVCGLCLVLDVLSLHRFEFFQRARLRLVGLTVLIAAWAGALGFAASQAQSHAAAVGVAFAYLILPAILAGPFVWTTIPILVDAIRTSATSEDRIKPVLTYDLAERAEVERRFEEAVGIYRREYQLRDPRDPVPRIRVGALLEKLGRPAEAVEELCAALPLIEDPEMRGIQASHAADLLTLLGRAGEAADLLDAEIASLRDDAVRGRLKVRRASMPGGADPPARP